MTRAGALGIALVLSAGMAQAQPAETLGWLRKVHDATQKLSYQGTFVYQQGNRSDTCRITRYVEARGDVERLEVLDGEPREIVRTSDTVRYYLPDSAVVKVDKRAVERGFPALLPERVTALVRHYELSLGERRRIAGFDCQEVVLRPRDDLRYGYRLYADLETGMPLKAVVFDAAGETVEQFMFTQLSIGNVTQEMVKPRHAARGWRIEDAGVAPARLAGWGLKTQLPGFQKVTELRRKIGESKPVAQVVYSDGLAAVSVFIEPLEGRRAAVRTGLASRGAINIYIREVANHLVTVVGETPAASVQRIANAVEYRRPQ